MMTTKSFHAALDTAFGFIGFDAEPDRKSRTTIYTNGVPHQSAKARFPGITIAARDLGVTRTHLWQVLSGNRDSQPLLKRWHAWLAAHPEFKRLQSR